MINTLSTRYYPQGPDMSSRYQAKQTVTGATAALTIQQPAVAAAASGGLKTVVFEYGVIVNTGAAATTFTVSQNGMGATATAGTASPLNGAPLATANVFTSSNVGTGAFGSQTFSVLAGATQVVDLSSFFLSPNGGIGQNLTIAAALFTGSISVQWIEK